jgi:hypothetical protein
VGFEILRVRTQGDPVRKFLRRETLAGGSLRINIEISEHLF